MPNAIWMLRLISPLVGLALAGAGCCVAPRPDFRVLRRPPVMTEAAEAAAVASDGSPLAEFAWSCDAYGAYIDELRGGKRLEDD